MCIYIYFNFSLPADRDVKIDIHMVSTSSCPQCVSKYIIDQLPPATDLCETLNGLSLMALLLISLCWHPELLVKQIRFLLRSTQRKLSIACKLEAPPKLGSCQGADLLGSLIVLL